MSVMVVDGGSGNMTMLIISSFDKVINERFIDYICENLLCMKIGIDLCGEYIYNIL